ncbi:MAG TPA: hypothetical protein PLL78_04205 [Fimbriimonadaceae bacterium]|nr:hypothetical protein [Fimbriimonadaceae bacterium]HRJ95865.1 hypothetical protein [Fimbriimonadaceae bacterium]
MKKLALIAAIAFAVVTAQANVTALPALIVPADPTTVEANLPGCLLLSDNVRFVKRSIPFNSVWHASGFAVFCENPLLMLGNYSRMEIRMEGFSSRATRMAVQARNGSGNFVDLGAYNWTTTETTRTLTLTGNVRRFILPGGLVNLFFHTLERNPFRQSVDRVWVTFR